VAVSSFHDFVYYIWDTSKGCPSFLVVPAGDEIHRHPERLADIKTYGANLARGLSPREK
jgi:hypothetical protein